MTQEELVLRISRDKYSGEKTGVTCEWINPDNIGFSRHLRVTTESGFVFRVEWYHNIVTFWIGNVKVWADSVWVDSCMPTRNRFSLRCSYKGMDSGFAIPLTYHNHEAIDIHPFKSEITIDDWAKTQVENV
jgi:hypothetical protein